MKIGMIFPGQGSQFLGMGKELYDRERIVQELFEQASSCLDQNFVRLCFASSERELRETSNAQTAIFLLSASISALLSEKYGIKPDIVAGHSSGEYSAIFTAGGMTFADALYLLKKRSQFMEEATKKVEGGMLAVLGLSPEKVQAICAQYDDPSGNEKVAEIVNHNSPEQFVVAGTMPELRAIEAEVKSIRGKAVMLNVAGAFHSRLMKEAEQLFAMYMVKVDFKDLTIPVVNNIAAHVVTKNDELKDSLIKQMSSHVLWWPSMQRLYDCDIVIEIGPHSKLSKTLKRTWPEKMIVSVNTPADIEQLHVLLGKEYQKSEIDLVIEEEITQQQQQKVMQQDAALKTIQPVVDQPAPQDVVVSQETISAVATAPVIDTPEQNT